MDGTDKIELKPCPFCAGAAYKATVQYDPASEVAILNGQAIFYYVSCTRCGASNCGLVGWKNIVQAAAHWNRRA